MASTKEDKISASPLKCCQSTMSVTSDSNDGEVCEVMHELLPTKGGNPLDTCNNNYNFHANNQQMKKHTFPKRPPADLLFDNISYTTWTWSMTRFRRERKEILHEVSGKFKSGELSAIMGPSGAGKTTLLNVLAGYTTRGSSGIVQVNNIVRDQSLRFRKLTAYIPQEEELRLELTAMEAMHFATNLKLGYTVTHEYKKQQATQLLEMLGLEQCHHTPTKNLSGGQRKRLAIALELINNPPILFLDEPTTGLDSLSCSQCVSLMKRLAQEGRTIICTIHQPSALIFEMFDQLYALAGGNCIYQGPVAGLVPHLATMGLQCPPYHNPADFLMEVSIGEYNVDLEKLTGAAVMCTTESFQFEAKEKEMLAIDYSTVKSIEDVVAETTLTPASVVMQFFLLYKRNLLCARRNYLYLFNRLAAHIFIGFLFGYLYRGVGKGADTALANYVYLYGSLLLIVYTGKMSVTLSFPLDMKVLNREHFNRWYNVTPYLISVILVEIPFQVPEGIIAWKHYQIVYREDMKLPGNLKVCPKISHNHIYPSHMLKMRVKLATQIFSNGMTEGLTFYKNRNVRELQDADVTIKTTKRLNDMFDALNRKIPVEGIRKGSKDLLILCVWSYFSISYWLTQQPVELSRIYLFVLFNTVCTLCAQSWGYLIGATLPIKIAVFVGPVLACLFSVFGFCLRYVDTPILFRWMYHISYFRAGFHGVVHSMYGLNRTALECPEELFYCHYKNPTKILQDMGVSDVSLSSNLTLIVVMTCLMHILTYIAIWLKLNKR